MWQGSFREFRPRHPLARIVAGVFGTLALLLLIALGMFAVAALAIGAGLVLLVNAFRSGNGSRSRSRAQPQAAPDPGVIEGEFTVLPDATPARDETGVHADRTNGDSGRDTTAGAG